MEPGLYLLLWGNEAAVIRPHALASWNSLAVFRWENEINFKQLKEFLYETKSR
jgi:hypothetical protein